MQHICLMCELTDSEIQQFKREIPQKLGCRIKEIRLQKKMTQIELSNKINSDRQYLYKIEKGKVGLSVVKLFIIAKALGVDVVELLTEIPKT